MKAKVPGGALFPSLPLLASILTSGPLRLLFLCPNALTWLLTRLALSQLSALSLMLYPLRDFPDPKIGGCLPHFISLITVYFLVVFLQPELNPFTGLAPCLTT